MVIAEKAKQKEKKVKRKTTTASILLGIFLIGIVSESMKKEGLIINFM